MHFHAIFALTTLAATTIALQIPLNTQSEPLQTTQNDRKRVAIIGAGLSGATIAYQLHKYDYPKDIVVFEATSQIGGLINSTSLDDKPPGRGFDRFLENGAADFRADDVCIQNAVDNAGLRDQVVQVPLSRTKVGVWDGYSFILRRYEDLRTRGSTEFMRDTLRYGLSVWKMQDLVKKKLALYQGFYPPGGFPQQNLGYVVRESGLEVEIKECADSYLLEYGISYAYLSEVVEPTVRRYFGRGLDDVNALAALIAMDPADTFRVRGGRTKDVVNRMLRLSEAEVRLESRVAGISRVHPDGKFLLTLADGNSSDFGNSEEPRRDCNDKLFDIVVIASHLQRANLDFDIRFAPGLTLHLPLFVSQHVTHFTSPTHTFLSRQFFNVDSTSDIPPIIYTQSNSSIFSIEWTIEEDQYKDHWEYQYLYKITSDQRVTDEFIDSMLESAKDGLQKVKWIHRHHWPLGSPEKVGRPKVDSLQLARGLYYTGVAEEFLPTLEMNCRLARTVGELVEARLRYGIALT